MKKWNKRVNIFSKLMNMKYIKLNGLIDIHIYRNINNITKKKLIIFLCLCFQVSFSFIESTV